MPFKKEDHEHVQRLQHLVGNKTAMRHHIRRFSEKMDHKLSRMKPALETILKKKGVTFDQFIQKYDDSFTPRQQTTFKGLIKTIEESSPLDWKTLLACSLLATETANPKPDIQAAVRLARFNLIAGGVEGLSIFFKLAEGASARYVEQVATNVTKSANKSEEDLRKIAAASEPNLSKEIENSAVFASKISTLVRILSTVGFVTHLVVHNIELLHQTDHKRKLLATIRSSQATRLAMEYFSAASDVVLRRTEQVALFVEAMAEAHVTSHDGTKRAAEMMSKKLVTGTLKKCIETDEFDWAKMQKELEARDKASGLQHVDDLKTHEVLQLVGITA